MMSFSLSTSMLEVASSKIYTGLLWSSARAKASRWHCPPDRLEARSSNGVSQPLLLPQEARQLHLLQHLPQLLLRGLGGRPCAGCPPPSP